MTTRTIITAEDIAIAERHFDVLIANLPPGAAAIFELLREDFEARRPQIARGQGAAVGDILRGIANRHFPDKSARFTAKQIVDKAAEINIKEEYFDDLEISLKRVLSVLGGKMIAEDTIRRHLR